MSPASSESVEPGAYDLTIRLRPGATGTNPRIAFIGITEDDIRKGLWPLPDATMAKALKVLLKSKIRAVDVDIFRDIQVPAL